MIVKQKILVTGANGQLGTEFRLLSSSFPVFEFIFATREEFPLDNIAAVKTFVDQSQAQYVVNCAAYTAVDKAEQPEEKALALTINADAVAAMAASCAERGARFIHISTDYVFNGQGTVPYKESDTTDPVNAYGETKLAGEQKAMEANPESIIIRTAWVYAAHGKNFVRTMLRLMADRSELSVVNDQSGTPTYAADLAAAITHIISSGEWEPGIYHFSNEGAITWFDFATKIAELAAPNCKIVPIPTSGFPTPAKRPAYSVLDKSKIKSTFNLSIPAWEESLKVCLNKIEK